MRRGAALFGITVAVALGIGACGGGDSGATTSNSIASGATAPDSATIPQPPLSTLNKLTRRRLAPDSRRVDLTVPTFSDPTKVTNPLFPISRLKSVVILGEVGGEPLKVETTLLPETKTVDWNGQRIECLQSQFLAYLKGRITESAVDLYAQADDGSVWYFGEDVVDYAKGLAATTEGTWVVGVDGPGAMIMPAHPKVGDVYRTENIPGVAWEEVTVKRTGKTVQGPTGPVKGAMVGQELHQDEVPLEPKTFAPGYGEFFSGGGHDFEANALTVPADATSGPTPAELQKLSNGADQVFDAARSKQWKAAPASIHEMKAAWSAYQAGQVPPRLAAEMSDALDTLDQAVGARDSRRAPQAALDVAKASLDLQLRYRPPREINLARFELWTRQLLADAAAKNAAALHGDVTTLGFIRDRIAFDSAAGNRIDDQLRYLRAVAEAKEFKVAMKQAGLLAAQLRADGAAL
ncbi:MAG: hypothetical protein AABM43_06275 [Actinomycetota bacterium]